MNHRQRLDFLELTMPPDRQEAIAAAAVGSLGDEDLRAIVEELQERTRTQPAPAFDRERQAAALARAPGARRTLAKLTRLYSRCRTVDAALALFRAARGAEPDRYALAAMRRLALGVI
jgi:predicted lipid-binding transport protein (Tim44 family)